MAEVELKRGYEVLPDNNVRFGIRVINNSDYAILDVEVILDYSESLFVLEGSKVQKLGTIPPAVPRTAEFKLKPRGCIHKEEIGAIVIYKDHQWKRHTLEMRAKEVHCVCPFLKEKTITRTDFLALLNSGYSEERGINFEAITVNKLLSFLFHTCKNKLYRVDEVPVENGKIIYLAGDALGEEAYYLLTAVVVEYEGIVQVLLRAASDKSYGLNGFLNEIVDNLRHLVTSASAREIGIIKKEQVINIIDSVVQRTTFAPGEGAASVNIEGSVVRRTEIKEDAEKSQRQEEERLRKEKEEQEKLRQEEAEKRKREEQKAKREEERLKREKEEQARKRQEQERLRRIEEEKKAREVSKMREARRGSSQKKILAVIFVFSAIALGFWVLAPDSNDVPSETTPLPAHTAAPNVANTPEVTQTDSQTSTPAADTGVTFTNTIGMEFVLIPAGEFEMGSPSDEVGRDSDEGPIHHVNIGNAFYMGRYEVTQKQWREVMGDNPSNFKSGDDLPIESVSWDDVQEFIKKLNEKEGTDKYRLPSEAEWEYACRAGTATGYSFGDSNSKLGDYAWYDGNSGRKTQPVGQKKPNPWGLYDMHGNVWEWVQDCWDGNYNGAPTDGSAWENGDGADRVFRGGSWHALARRCRSANRFDDDPRYRSSILGFRILQEL